MKHAIGLATIIFVGIIVWQIGGNMSSNALSMAVGVLFGVLAGIPHSVDGDNPTSTNRTDTPSPHP